MQWRWTLTTVAVLTFGAALLVARSADAHTSGGAYLEVQQTNAREALVRLFSPSRSATLAAHFERDCTLTPRAREREPPEIQLFQLRCASGLQSLAMSGFSGDANEVAVYVRFQGGATQSALLSARQPRLDLSGSGRQPLLKPQVVELGATHVLAGADHLVFLLLLVFSVGRFRQLLLAETAFTLGHTLAFAGTCYGWLSISPRVAEACIALSLLMLALDAGRTSPQAGGAGRVFWQPLVFGSVHGLGFGGGLLELGFVHADLPSLILSFGLGVELAQVAFVLLMFGGVLLLRRGRVEPQVSVLSTYAAGGLAVAWLVDRVGVVLQSTS